MVASAKLAASALAVAGSSDEEENDPDKLAEEGVVATARVPLTFEMVPDAVSMKANVAVPRSPVPAGSVPASVVLSEDEENHPDRVAEPSVVPSLRVPLTLGWVPDAVFVTVKFAVPESPASIALAGAGVSALVAVGVSVPVPAVV